MFDVCDTLFSTNTTIGFLRFYADRLGDRAMSATLDRWTSAESWCFYAGAISHRFLHQDLARRRLIQTLKGHSFRDLEAAARDYVEAELPAQANLPVHQRLYEHLDRGDSVVLASSSLDLIVAQIARELGVEFVASELSYADGVCTGRLTRDLSGQKPSALASHLADKRPIQIYTDNRSDANLIQLADRKTVILPAGPRQQRWAGEDCEYVAL